MTNEETGYQIFEQQLDQTLDEYKASLHLKVVDNFSDIEQLFNLSRDQLESIDEESALNYSARLTQYALFIQQQENREKAKFSWAENQIALIAGKHWDDFDKFLPKDIKIAKISCENPSVVKLSLLREKSQNRINEIFGISQLIRYYSNIFVEKAKHVRNRRFSQ